MMPVLTAMSWGLTIASFVLLAVIVIRRFVALTRVSKADPKDRSASLDVDRAWAGTSLFAVTAGPLFFIGLGLLGASGELGRLWT